MLKKYYDKNNIMPLTLIKSKSTLILVYFYLFMLVYWYLMNLDGLQNTLVNFIFGSLLAFVPIIGALFGFTISKKWGFLSSKLGKAIFYVSTGLLFWGFATIIFAYFNIVMQQDVPYPSIADIFYLLLYVFYTLGAYQLMHVVGAKKSLKSIRGKIAVGIVPFIIFILTYFLFIGNLTESLEWLNLEFVLDLVYPFLDSILLCFALLTLLLSFGQLGGRYRVAIYTLLVGFIVEYFADLGFSYTTSSESFYVGNWVDLLFLTSTFLVSFSITLLSPVFIINNGRTK